MAKIILAVEVTDTLLSAIHELTPETVLTQNGNLPLEVDTECTIDGTDCARLAVITLAKLAVKQREGK